MGANQVHHSLNNSSKVLSSIFEATRDNQGNGKISESRTLEMQHFDVRKMRDNNVPFIPSIQQG